MSPGKDHPLVTRFPGRRLVGYFQRDWEATSFPLSSDIDTSTQRFGKPVSVEGRINRLYYLAPVNKSPLEVFRTYQQAFAEAGLTPPCEENCGMLFFRWRWQGARLCALGERLAALGR